MSQARGNNSIKAPGKGWKEHKDTYYRLVYFRERKFTKESITTMGPHSQEAYMWVEEKMYVCKTKITFAKPLNGLLEALLKGPSVSPTHDLCAGRTFQDLPARLLPSLSSQVMGHLITLPPFPCYMTLYKIATSPPQTPTYHLRTSPKESKFGSAPVFE